MSKVVSTSNYTLVAPNIIFESSLIQLTAPTTNITGNLTVEGYISTKTLRKNNVENFNSIICNEITANKLIINGVISSDLLINGTITTNATNTTAITTQNINMNNGVINIANGIINGPVKIYGLQVVNLNEVFANRINFKSIDNETNYSFNIENINVPPPGENCNPTWIKVKINGASFYIFSQMTNDD